MGISPETTSSEDQARNSVIGIRTSSLLTPEYINALLKKIEDKEKMNGHMTPEVITQEPRSSQTLPSRRQSNTVQLSPRRCPSAHVRPSKSKIAIDTRRVLEKFLERSLSLNDATPMQKVYLAKDGELDIIEEDGPVTDDSQKPSHNGHHRQTPVVTPVEASSAIPVCVKPPGNKEVKPHKLKKSSTHPAVKYVMPSPDEDVWVLQSKIVSPGSQSSKSEETLKADSTLVSDESPKSKSSSNIASPQQRPHSSVIAQTEFSVVNELDSELSPRKSKLKHQSLDNLLSPTRTTGPVTLSKADTISTTSRDQYLKELAAKPKDTVKNDKKKSKAQKPKPGNHLKTEAVKISSLQKSMTISSSSYQDWKVEKKLGVNGKRRNSRDSELDILDQTSNLQSTASKSTSSISSDDYHEPKVAEDGNRKKKTGFKRAMERLRMSYRRKVERTSSVNSADYYSVKPKTQKPVFKKKKHKSSLRFFRFWKKSGSSDEREKVKGLGLNDPGLLEDSHSDDAKKGVIIKNKHHHKKDKKSEENAFDTLIRQIRKGGTTLRRRISRKESLRSPGPKSKSLDVLDESPGSSLDLCSTTNSLPEKNYLTVDPKLHGRRHRKSPSGSLQGSPTVSHKADTASRSPKVVTEEFSIILDSQTDIPVSPVTPHGDGFSVPPGEPSANDDEDALLDAYAKQLQSTVKNKEMRKHLKLDGLSRQTHKLPETDLVTDGLGDGDGAACKTSTPNSVAQKTFEQRTDDEKEIIYDRVAKKLAEIADNYVQKVESSHESSSEPASPMVLTASSGNNVINPLELRLADMLRDKGDAIYENGELPTEAVKKIVADQTYSQFQKHVSTILPKTDGFQQIAVLFHLTKSAVQWAGVGAQQAGRIKEMSLRFFEDKFAEWLSDQGGWDSVVEDSSDFELD